MIDGAFPLEGASREQRFRRLYGALQVEIFAYLRRRSDAETAKDALAETFLVVWRRLDDVPDGDGSRPWVYGIARRVLSNQHRSVRRFRGLRRRLAGADIALAQPAPDTVVVRASELQSVVEAMDRLKPTDREVLRLAAWEELSHAEIGQVLGCTAHAVDQRVLRAKRRLEHELQRGRYAAIGVGRIARAEQGGDG